MPRKRCEKMKENKLISPVTDPILVTFGKMQFSRSQLCHFLFMLLLFKRYHFEFLLSYPKNPKICDPMLVTLLKSQHSRENATSSSAPRPPSRVNTFLYTLNMGTLKSIVLYKASFELAPAVAIDQNRGRDVQCSLHTFVIDLPH